MLKDSLNKKTYIGDIEPNPKEFGIWVKEDGSAKIYDYIKDEWVGGSGSGSGNELKWEYYKIDYSDASFNDEAMWIVFDYVTLVNDKDGDTLYITPRGDGWGTIAAIAGVSAKHIAGEFVIDTGSWLGNVKEIDKKYGENHDYSFLIPITKEEFYSDNFDYPTTAPV